MLASSTPYRAEEGRSKQLTMPQWAAFALSNSPEMSKGLVANECVLSAPNEYSDELTEIELAVQAELAREAGGECWSLIENKISGRVGAAKDRLAENCPYEDPEERVKSKVYLVRPIWDQLPQRYNGDLVANAVAWHYASPWASRIERIRDLQQLTAWTRGATVDEQSEWVAAVMDRDDEWADLHDRLAPGQEWYESPDITLDDLRDRADDIPVSRGPRVAALETALSNDGRGYTRDEMVDLAREVYDCVPQTAAAYADDIDLVATEPEDGYRVNVASAIDEVIAETEARLGQVKFRNVRNNLEPYQIAGFRDDPTVHDGYYDSREAAVFAMNGISQKRASIVKSWQITKENSEEMKEWIRERFDEIQDERLL